VAGRPPARVAAGAAGREQASVKRVAAARTEIDATLAYVRPLWGRGRFPACPICRPPAGVLRSVPGRPAPAAEGRCPTGARCGDPGLLEAALEKLRENPEAIRADSWRHVDSPRSSLVLSWFQLVQLALFRTMCASESWVSVDEVAGHLGVARDTVYRRIDSRALPAHRVGRKFTLFEVDAWVRSGSAADEPIASDEARRRGAVRQTQPK